MSQADFADPVSMFIKASFLIINDYAQFDSKLFPSGIEMHRRNGNTGDLPESISRYFSPYAWRWHCAARCMMLSLSLARNSDRHVGEKMLRQNEKSVSYADRADLVRLATLLQDGSYFQTSQAPATDHSRIYRIPDYEVNRSSML